MARDPAHSKSEVVLARTTPTPAHVAIALAVWACLAQPARGAVLTLESDDGARPSMTCMEWAGFVQSMADSGPRRFLVVAREFVKGSKWPFVLLAGDFVEAYYLEGSNGAGAMAFAECRGIP